MATTTPNFGWPVPTSSDLVKNGATAIEALGDGIDASLLDLKGGTTGQVLKKNTNTDMDFVWGTVAGGGGKVLQVVTATYSTSTSNSSTTYADTGLTATITPTLSTSKVLVLVFHNGITKTAAVNYQQMAIKLFRGATEILLSAGIDYTATATDASTTWCASLLDSPATTSATTYKTQFNSAGVASVTIQNGSSTSTITLLEIGA